jgi:hypothetical protein
MGYIKADWLRRRRIEGWGADWRTVWWWTRRVGYLIVIVIFAYPVKAEFLITGVELNSDLLFSR